ncbi:MAG: hypothetical protein WAQ98_22225 [Blastocatellia bacterium]
MKNYINNSFSLNMLDLKQKASIEVIPVSVIEEDMAYDEKGMDIFHFSDAESIWGHEDSVVVVRKLFPVLKEKIAYNRKNVTLKKSDRMLVIQRIGQRLPEQLSSSTISVTDPNGFEWGAVVVVIS